MRKVPGLRSKVDGTVSSVFGSCYREVRSKSLLLMFRRAERSLFAQVHVKMIFLPVFFFFLSFFFPSVTSIPLRFMSSNVIFEEPIGRIYPIFVKTLRQVHDPSFSKFLAADVFFRRIGDKIFSFRIL